MWPFRRKQSLLESGIFQGFTDYHCHILPGVDDGLRTIEDALAVLAYYEGLGISQVWLTPHVMEDIPNTTENLKEQYNKLVEAYQGRIQLHLAAEYMLDPLFDERLKAGDLLPVGKDRNHLLVETSYYNAPAGLIHTLEEIKAKGYYPVLAHPERYRYMEDKDYDRLHQMGVKFQLNLPALAGMYSPNSQKAAQRLLKKGYYTIAGTDLHTLGSFKRAIGEDNIHQSLQINELKSI